MNENYHQRILLLLYIYQDIISYLKEGDAFRDFTGPLGCASEFVKEDLESLFKKVHYEDKKKNIFVNGKTNIENKK